MAFADLLEPGTSVYLQASTGDAAVDSYLSQLRRTGSLNVEDDGYSLRSIRRLLRYTGVRSGLAGADHGDADAIARVTLERLADDPAAQARWRRWIAGHYEPTLLRGQREASALYPGVAALLADLRAAGLLIGLLIGLVSDYRGVPD